MNRNLDGNNGCVNIESSEYNIDYTSFRYRDHFGGTADVETIIKVLIMMK